MIERPIIKHATQIIGDPEIQKVITASESHWNLFGASTNRMPPEIEEQRSILEDIMLAHREIITPASALTIMKKKSEYTYKWSHKIFFDGQDFCRGFVAKSGTDYPGIVFFRLDDRLNTTLYENRKSTQHFFSVLLNIFLSSGELNTSFGGIHSRGGTLFDKLVMITDYSYIPLSVCVIENSKYTPLRNSALGTERFTDTTLPWQIQFEAIEFIR